MSLRKTYLLGGFVALALLSLALADTGETVSEAAPLLGFTDTPVPVVPTPLPAPTNTPPPAPPTPTDVPVVLPTDTPRPQQKRQTEATPTPIPILPESGQPEKGPISPWVVGGVALFLGWLVLWSGQRHKDVSRPSSSPSAR